MKFSGLKFNITILSRAQEQLVKSMTGWLEIVFTKASVWLLTDEGLYQPQCMKSNAFNIGETVQMLSKHMNGHRSICTIVNSDLLVLHTKSHRLPFQECWSISTIYKLPDTTPNHVCHQLETTYQDQDSNPGALPTEPPRRTPGQAWIIPLSSFPVYFLGAAYYPHLSLIANIFLALLF